MTSRLLIIIVVIVVLAGAVGAGLLIFSRRNPAPTTPSNQSTTTSTESTTTTTTSSSTAQPAANSVLSADPVQASTDSKARFTAASKKISEWSLVKPNFAFTGLFMSFDAKLTYNSANEVYVFDSPDERDNHYTVSVAQSSGNMLRALVPVSDYQGVLLPIKTEFWLANYVEAVQFADQNGGSSFAANNQVTSVDVNLLRTTPNNFLYWVVTYKTKDPTISLTVKMDAKDKVLVKE